jgi:putative hydrolase of the HAD superfamily
MKIYEERAFDRLPDAVVFDFDNTMYPYDPAHSAAMAAVAAKAEVQISVSRDDFLSAFDEARARTKATLGKTAAAHSRLLYFHKTFEVLGLKSQVFNALDFEQAYWRTFLAHQHLYEGARELVEDLRAVGVPTAITTDLTSQIQFRKLVYTGLDRLFDHVVTSEEAGHDKPHPEMFSATMRKFGMTDGVVWMIGDDVPKDMEGAKATISAVTLLRCDAVPRIRPPSVDLAFSRFSDVRSVVSGLVRRMAS